MIEFEKFNFIVYFSIVFLISNSKQEVSLENFIHNKTTSFFNFFNFSETITLKENISFEDNMEFLNEDQEKMLFTFKNGSIIIKSNITIKFTNFNFRFDANYSKYALILMNFSSIYMNVSLQFIYLFVIVILINRTALFRNQTSLNIVYLYLQIWQIFLFQI